MGDVEFYVVMWHTWVYLWWPQRELQSIRNSEEFELLFGLPLNEVPVVRNPPLNNSVAGSIVDDGIPVYRQCIYRQRSRSAHLTWTFGEPQKAGAGPRVQRFVQQIKDAVKALEVGPDC